MLEVGDVYNHLKDSVAIYELLLLRVLQFKLKVELPHKVFNLCIDTIIEVTLYVVSAKSFTVVIFLAGRVFQ